MWPHRSTLLWLFENVSGGPGTVLWQTHFIYTRPWLKAQMRRRHQKLGATKIKNLTFLILSMPLQPNGNTDWSSGIEQPQDHNTGVQAPGKLYFTCFNESAQVAVQWCCPIWWSSIQSLSPPHLENPILCFFLFCPENKFFRDKRSRDKEDYYAVFALRADFVLFCLLCL